MRTLLEIHYDAVHLQRWKHKNGKAPTRKSEWHVFNSTIHAHRKQLCQRIILPKAVKNILRMPRDEDDTTKLEQLRDAISREIEGYECIPVD